MLFIDSSALVKRYIEEEGSVDVVEAMADADQVATSRLTRVEVGRAIALGLAERSAREARAMFEEDWLGLKVVELDRVTCELALEVAVETGLRSLDALQLASMLRIGGDDVRLLTRDARQARGALDVGLPLHAASTPG